MSCSFRDLPADLLVLIKVLLRRLDGLPIDLSDTYGVSHLAYDQVSDQRVISCQLFVGIGAQQGLHDALLINCEQVVV